MLSFRDRVNASFVCRRWNSLCKDAHFWRMIDFSLYDINGNITDTVIKTVTTRCSNASSIRSVDLSGDICRPITNKALHHVAKHCPNLEQLSLARRSNISDNGIKLVTSRCRDLKMLNIEDCVKVGDNGLKSLASKCAQLESLIVAGCPKVTDKGLIAVARNCSNLRVLNIAGCQSVSDKTMLVLGQCCSNLQDINLKDTHDITIYGIENLVRNTPRMTHIKLGIIRDSQNTIAALQIIVEHCQNLQFLTFQHHRNPRVKGGIRKINKKKLGPFINNLNACIVAQIR